MSYTSRAPHLAANKLTCKLLKSILISLPCEFDENNTNLDVSQLLQDVVVHGVIRLGGIVAVGKVGKLGDNLLENPDNLVRVPRRLRSIQVEDLHAA